MHETIGTIAVGGTGRYSPVRGAMERGGSRVTQGCEAVGGGGGACRRPRVRAAWRLCTWLLFLQAFGAGCVAMTPGGGLSDAQLVERARRFARKDRMCVHLLGVFPSLLDNAVSVDRTTQCVRVRFKEGDRSADGGRTPASGAEIVVKLTEGGALLDVRGVEYRIRVNRDISDGGRI